MSAILDQFSLSRAGLNSENVRLWMTFLSG